MTEQATDQSVRRTITVEARRRAPELRPGPGHATEVEAIFTADGPSTSHVVLEHRGFERHGEPGAAMRASVASPDGWSGLLERFARALAA